MHRWLLLVMIALLPLRGWVGEAMAGQMLQQQLAGVEAVATQATQAAAHEDCMGHATPADDSTAASPTDCPSCASCQVCSSVALAFNATALQPIAFSPPAPTTFVHRFASAEPAPALKPPIS